MKKLPLPPFSYLLILAGLGSAATVLGAPPTPTGHEYTIINLGTIGGTASEAVAINDLGQVVGQVANSTGGNRAVLFSGTGIGNTELGTLGGHTSEAIGINNSGQILGSASTADANSQATLFSGTGRGNVNLGTLGGVGSRAYAINDSGEMVGGAWISGGSVARAALFNASGNTDLGTIGNPRTNGDARSINNFGQIVGFAYDLNANFHATLYSGTGTGNKDLGTLGGNYSVATAINDSGLIAGYAYTSGDAAHHATLFSGTGGGNIDLGTLGGTNSRVTAINNSGQFAGFSQTSGNTATHGFLISGGVMQDLNSLAASSATTLGVKDITLKEVGNSLNDWGQIAAIGIISGQKRALLLNPSSPLTGTSSGGQERNTKFVGGMNYSKFTTTGTGGPTTVSLLGGIAGSGSSATYGRNRDVDVSIHGGAPEVYGNLVDFTGTGDDVFVLSLGYQEAGVLSRFGSENEIVLGWLNASGIWVNAVSGNEGGSARFMDGPWNDSYTLGTYGIDRINNSVWAVINHNSTFGIIPEPSATLSMSAGAMLFLRRRRRLA